MQGHQGYNPDLSCPYAQMKNTHIPEQKAILIEKEGDLKKNVFDNTDATPYVTEAHWRVI